jgi:hypothetical protein
MPGRATPSCRAYLVKFVDISHVCHARILLPDDLIETVDCFLEVQV